MTKETAYGFTVPMRDIGPGGTMHSFAYIAYAQEALAAFWAGRAHEAGDPVFCVTKVGCHLHKPLQKGDRVEAEVRVSKIGGKTAGFTISMYRVAGTDRQLAAEAEIVWTACHAESGEPVPLQEDLRDWLYRNLE
ncbi:thioesterase family protein [Rhizobium sp. SSA_523]|uniref:acyl-CoA thioesterase n=1 Tax=Rhizobium sp. SSA_523 TaxID=2952477 RepID=UPI002090A3CC|nr:thioesterase family protein [Rhizobium sp. SSA_523]MCO5731075.1 acyl-CoA thioesterase [Rhizobium sp. SSA_523]WKC24124.1 hotdog domain-containing protein [Rhizobium sp. SSA_523]